MNNWQPIETVPKDGTSVLLCWGEYDPQGASGGVSVQVAGWWADEGDDGEWVVYCALSSEPRWLHFTPTHWQPLPDPPEA